MSTASSPQVPGSELPGRPIPYVVRAGHGRAHQLISDVARAVAGGEETQDRMSFLTNVGARGARPIPLHSHEREQEFFLCVDGAVQLWAGEDSRVLVPGDFGFIPAGTVHAYQHLRHGSCFVGPVIPAGWDRFFDFVGEPFSGGAWAPPPYGPPPFARFAEAEARFDQVFRPDLAYAPATAGSDDELPGEVRPYFLSRGEGPKHLLGGQLQTALCRTEETAGALSMVVVDLPHRAGLPRHVHEHTHEVLYVVAGQVTVTLDGTEHLLNGGDAASVPSGTPHAYVAESRHARILSTGAPAGLERLFISAGDATDAPIYPIDPDLRIDRDRLTAAAEPLDVTFV